MRSCEAFILHISAGERIRNHQGYYHHRKCISAVRIHMIIAFTAVKDKHILHVLGKLFSRCSVTLHVHILPETTSSFFFFFFGLAALCVFIRSSERAEVKLG